MCPLCSWHWCATWKGRVSDPRRGKVSGNGNVKLTQHHQWHNMGHFKLDHIWNQFPRYVEVNWVEITVFQEGLQNSLSPNTAEETLETRIQILPHWSPSYPHTRWLYNYTFLCVLCIAFRTSLHVGFQGETSSCWKNHIYFVSYVLYLIFWPGSKHCLTA